MKKILLIGSIVFIGAMLTVYTGYSQQGKHLEGQGKGMHPGCHGKHMHPNLCRMLQVHADEISLTEEQLNKIDELCTEQKDLITRLHADMKILHDDLRAEMEKDESDRRIVSDISDEISAIRGQIMKSRLMLHLDIKELLTPEQREIIKELKAEKRDRIKERINRFNPDEDIF